MTHGEMKQAALDRIQFNPDAHVYTLDGYRLPSVTQVIEPLTGLSSLPPERLVAARERGTLVHALTQFVDTNLGAWETAEIVEDAEAVGLTPYLEAWQAFKREANPTFHFVEQRVLHFPLRYAGTADRIGLLGKQWTVFEIKTGEYYPEYALQTAAYMDAWNEALLDPKMVVTRRICVTLEPNGRYRLKEHTNPRDTHAFRAALTIAGWRASP